MGIMFDPVPFFERSLCADCEHRSANMGECAGS